MSQQKIARLAAELENLREQVRVLQTTPQLPNSSIDDGAVNVYDRDGQQTMQVGKQYDGTFVAAPVAGPTPPQPSAANVEAIPGGLRIAWDGEFFMGAVAPMDFARVEVHVSTASGFDPSFAGTLRGTIETPRGADVVVLGLTPATPHYVKLVCRAQTGKGSASSVEVEGTPRKVVASDLDVEGLKGTTIHYGPDDPALVPESTVTNGDVWLEEVAAGPPPQYVTHRRVSDAWVELADQTASQAVIDALAAQQAAADAELVAQGKLTVFYQATEPAYAGDPGTAVWYDTDNGNTPYVWSAAGAVPARTNRVTNPSFEGGDISGWSNSAGATNLRATASNNALAWDWSGNANECRVLHPGIPVTPGEELIAYAQARNDVRGGDLQLVALFYDVNGSYISSHGVVVLDQRTTLENSNAEFFGQFTVPNDPAIITMAIGINDPLPTAGNVYIADKVLVESMPADREFRGYFDGYSANAVWNGTPQASTSTLAASTEGWVRRRIGTGAVAPKSLVASDVIATGTVTAALLESVMVLTNVLIAGNPNGEHTRVDKTGVSVLADVAGDGTPEEITRLGRQSLGINPATGKPSWLIDETGGATFQGLDVTEEPVVAGKSLTEFIDARLDTGSRNIVAAGGRALSNYQPGVTEKGIFDVRWKAKRGRAYRLSLQGGDAFVGPSGMWMAVPVRREWGTDSATVAPTVSSDRVFKWQAASTDGIAVDASHIWYPDMPGTEPERWVRCLVSTQCESTATSFVINAEYLTLMVEDIGPIKSLSATTNTSTGTSGSGNTGGSTAPTTYVTEFPATWGATWHTSGGKSHSGNPLVQGANAGYNRRSSWGWDSAAVVSALSGAAIHKVEFYIYADHWYYNSGGTLRFGWHGQGSEPASYVGGNAWTEYGGFPRYAGRWIDITWMAPASGSSIQNGAIKGLSFEAPSTNLTYYGKFAYGTNVQPKLRVTYSK